MLRFETVSGLTPYGEGLEIISKAQEQRIQGLIPDTVYFMEHTPVVTLGRGNQQSNETLERPRLPNTIDFFELNRGGGLTAHGPGMLMIYPIVELGASDGFCNKRDIGAYLRKLEEVIIRTLADFDILAYRREGATGVWVDDDASTATRKIASIGISVRKWVTLHGVALNLNNDLSLFEGFSPCGFEASVMTRLCDRVPKIRPGQSIDEPSNGLNTPDITQLIIDHFRALC